MSTTISSRLDEHQDPDESSLRAANSRGEQLMI
jgi:hypothetical protein